MTFAEVQRYPRDWGVMDETPRRYDPATGKVVPIIPYGFDINRPFPDSSNNFPVPLPPIPEDMHTVDDDYEIYVDHDDGQKIKSRPKVKKKEIFIGPSGRPLPEDEQEQIRGYGTEQDTMSFLESFLNEKLAGGPVMPSYILDSIRRQYKGGKDYTIEDKKNVLDWYSRFKV